MALATPDDLQGHNSQASRQRVARAFGLAICSLAVIACVLVAVGQQASSELAQDPSAAASRVFSAPAKAVSADKTVTEARDVVQQAKQKWLELKKLEQQPAKRVGLAPLAADGQPPRSTCGRP